MTAPAMVVPDLFLAEIDHYNPDEEAVETLTVATSEYRTGPERENLVRQSEKMNTTPWGKTAGITVTENAAEAPDGTTTANFIENAAGLVSENINIALVAFTGDGEKCASVFLKAGTATQTDVNIRDATAGVNRHIINVAWSNGVPTATSQSGSGQVFPATPVPNRPGWWRVAFTATGIVAANTHVLHIYPTGTGQIAGNVYAWGAQVEDASGPSDYIKTTTVAVTRPNPNVVYDPILLQPGNVRRDMFDIGTTSGPSRTALGTVEVGNADGLLDALIDHGFDARGIRLLRAPAIPRPEYPLGFTTELVASMQDAEFGHLRVSFPIRDELRALDVPIQSTKYAGDNVAPDGLEGTAELTGKPKPILLGRRRNVRVICVNAQKRIYQISDDAIQSVEDVYDSGLSLKASPVSWPNTSSFVNLTDTRALVFGDGLWVAGGAGGGSPRIETSPDGVTWTARTPSGINGNASAIAYSPDLNIFVAVSDRVAGDGGSSSPDGITWTSRDQGTDEILNAVSWCPSAQIFVAVGNSGALVTSTNGTSWTARTSSFGATNIWGVSEGGLPGARLIVAVGEDGKIATSPDGITWTQRISQFDTDDVYAVAYSEDVGRWVIGGFAGKLAHSVDGFTWSLVPSGFFENDSLVRFLYGIYAAGWFVFPDFIGRRMAVSRDGVTWQSFETGASSGVHYEVAYSPTLGVFGTVHGGTFRYTPGVTDYPSLADLEDDSQAPAWGSYKTYLAGGYIRLGSSPIGEVTADASEGANAAARTAAQLAVRVFERMGYTTGDWSAADVTAHDAASDYEMGLYIDEETTARDVLNQLMAPRSSVFQDAAGVLRIKQLTLPTGAPVLELTASDFKRPLERIRTRDTDRGIPPHRCIVKYSRNGVVQTSGLAAGVADDRRALLAQEWLTVEANDPDILDVHPLAQERTDETCICDQADAETEVAALLTLRGTRRDYFVGTIERNAQTSALELNDIVQVTVPRYGMENGKKFRVLSLDKKNDAKEIEISLWGGVAA